MMGLDTGGFKVSKSKKTFDGFNRYWKRFMDAHEDEVNAILKS